MEWHIITASKGGVGKTLMTLLLLAYYLEEKTNEGILVVDLNAMNTDTSAMLLQAQGGNIEKLFPFCLPKSRRNIWSRSVSSQDHRFAVAWSADPFFMYGRAHFAELLVTIKEKKEDISAQLNIPPLQHVIIDTNYHFCNLFPPQDEQYEKTHWGSLTDDDVVIWFIWVYRQLKKILGEKSEEITLINRTAGAIERIFKPQPNKMGPLVHTYTPVGLLPTDSDDSSIWSKWFGGTHLPNVGEDYLISDLKKLENLEKIGPYISFNPWMGKLQQAYQSVLSNPKKANTEDIRQLFGKILYEAVKKINDEDQLPMNIFLLSLYEAVLAGYTDRERVDVVAGLKELETYKNFRKLLCRKRGDI